MRKKDGMSEVTQILMAIEQGDARADDLIALDETLSLLEETDKTKAELVKLRFFAGLTLVQAAELMDMSLATAKRHRTYAKAWLYGMIHPEDA